MSIPSNSPLYNENSTFIAYLVGEGLESHFFEISYHFNDQKEIKSSIKNSSDLSESIIKRVLNTFSLSHHYQHESCYPHVIKQNERANIKIKFFDFKGISSGS
jgi:hypothetical protein